jgi:hypothetical protein
MLQLQLQQLPNKMVIEHPPVLDIPNRINIVYMNAPEVLPPDHWLTGTQVMAMRKTLR